MLVLWACALMAIMLGGFAALARSEGLQARYQFASVRARYAAEAGLARAVAGLGGSRRTERRRGSGRPFTFTFAGATVHVKVVDEDGKVDINTATPGVLAALLHNAGVKPRRAHDLAAAVADWRDADNNPRPGGAEAASYRRAGRDYGPRNGPFASIEELQLVLGMNAGLYVRIAPLVTIWSGRNMPNPAHATAAVLAALPGMDKNTARRYVATRRGITGTRSLPPLPNGMAVVAGGGGRTFSVVSTAKLAGGTQATLHATIRLGGHRRDGAPYVVLQWREGRAGE